MPPPINVDERLDQIAVATLAVAHEKGASGVTIRAVATQLGGSTTRVTKYLPSRAALLANAARYMGAQWSSDLASVLEQRTGIDGLRALTRWSLNTEARDQAIRRLWIDALATDPTLSEDPVLGRRQARREQERIRTLAASALPTGHYWLADTLFLAFRGYYLSTIEDPAGWPRSRAADAIERLLDLVEASLPSTNTEG